MANLDLNFDGKPNSSLQKGDLCFYLTPTGSATFTTYSGEPTKLGSVKSITIHNSGNFTIQVDVPDSVASPSAGDFLLFSKDTRANYSGVTGYYSEITFTNNKTSAAELYSINSEVFESSK